MKQTPETPSPRIRSSFDFDWKFLRGDISGAENINYADADWQNINLPHDWSIEGPFAEQPGSVTFAHLPTGTGWYRKHFQIPESYHDKQVVIEFDGAYQNSEVWINGHLLGKRPYGYISFSYDLTEYLKLNEDNILAVRVDNSRQPNCRWYSGSGIYRHTWLRVTGKLHIAQWGTFVTAPEVHENIAFVYVKTTVQNEGKTSADCTLNSQIINSAGKVVRALETKQLINAGGSGEYIQQIEVDKPEQWSPENPYLYTLRSLVSSPDGIVDSYDTSFGIRTAVFDADRGFLLNGRQIKLHGVCLHHEGGAVGAAVPDQVWQRRLEKLKAMGCNSIRTSHNPFTAEFMDMCDRLGFLVMNEIYDEWKEPKPQTPDYGYRIYFDEWAERDVTDFVRRDRNHPSVIIWSAGNEVVDQIVPEGVATLKKLLAVFRREDPTRPVTVACDRIVAEPAAASEEFLSLLDVVGYNYVDRWRERVELYYSLDRHKYPTRKFIGTENGSLGGPRGDYSWLFPGHTASRANLRNNRWIDFEQMWKFVRLYDYVAGDYMWTGIDYLGEARWPNKFNTSGVLDSCGFAKDTYYFCQSQWTEKPMVHLFPHWNWQGKEGEFIPVYCYTNCDSAELFLNGKSLGVQGYWFPRFGMKDDYENYPARNDVVRTTSDLHLRWTVPYQPGTLRAVGYKDGNAVANEEIITSGLPVSISLAPDKSQIRANQRDVVHVTVQLLDAQGRVVPTADQEINFAVEGAGRLIGLDNGDPASHEYFKGNRRKLYHGLALALIQSTAFSGKITLTASSPGLLPGNLVIEVI